MQALKLVFYDSSFEVCHRGHSIGCFFSFTVKDEVLKVRIVRIDERKCICGEGVEQLFLSREILVKRLVVIEVVMGDVCEDCAGKCCA